MKRFRQIPAINTYPKSIQNKFSTRTQKKSTRGAGKVRKIMEKSELREAVQKNLATRIHPQIHF